MEQTIVKIESPEFRNIVGSYLTMARMLANEISRRVRNRVPKKKLTQVIEAEKSGSLNAIDDVYGSPAEIISECFEHLFPKCHVEFNEDFFAFTNAAWDIALDNNFNQVDLNGEKMKRKRESTTLKITLNHKGDKNLAISRLCSALDRVTNYQREDDGILSFHVDPSISHSRPISN